MAEQECRSLVNPGSGRPLSGQEPY